MQPGQLARVSEHAVQIKGEAHQSLILDIVVKLSVDRTTLLPGHDAAPHQELERVRHFKIVELCVGNLRDGTVRRARRAGFEKRSDT